LNIHETELKGVFLIEPKVHGDQRGFFKETYSRRNFLDHGLDLDFVQDNASLSSKGVLRGLHFQNPHSQGKLVQVALGEALDVVVDIRPDSPTFGRGESFLLSSENHRQLYISPGFAHGFLTLSEKALFVYKCTDFYHPESEHTLLWNDPALGIEWPDMEFNVSEKDQAGLLLSDFSREELEVAG
jgi:dTDP-4-dehydrorhamnose 3,5-epimerase